MLAIRVKKFGGPEVLQLEDMPSLTPGQGEVVVAIKAAGVNPVDTYIREGAYALKTSCPYTPGMDGAGVITSIGEGVLAFAPGDRVYLSGPAIGTYAQEAICSVQEICHPAGKHHLYPGRGDRDPVSDRLSGLIHQGPGRGQRDGPDPWRQRRGRDRGHPSGPPGRVTGPGHGRQCPRARIGFGAGADLAFNHGQPNYLEEICAAAAPSGIDIILETHAEINLARDLDLISERGRVVIIGCRGDIQISPRVMMAKEAASLAS